MIEVKMINFSKVWCIKNIYLQIWVIVHHHLEKLLLFLFFLVLPYFINENCGFQIA